MVSLKDNLKMFGISIVCFCSIYVCALFLNFYQDLKLIEDELDTAEQAVFFEAQIMTCKVVCGAAGGGLFLTSIVLLVFYIKHYIDTHKKELGILKALGYDNGRIAIRFWVFGFNVLLGTVLGYLAAFLTMPTYYEVQNENDFLPDIPIHFHGGLFLLLVVVPALVFALLSIGVAFYHLRVPALRLIRGGSLSRVKKIKDDENQTFLAGLSRSTAKQRKSLVFFIAFGAFCFSGMTQMSASMNELSSEMMGLMMRWIGYILAFVSLLLSLTTIVKANQRTATMMRVFGYTQKECEKAIFNGYRPWNYLGFAIGSLYQYVLLKVMVSIVFKDIDGVPEYHFDYKNCIMCFLVYLLIYEAAMKIYGNRLSKMSVKEIMTE